MLNWSIEFIGSEILSKMLEGGYKKIIEKVEENELRQIVSEFNSRFKAQMENAALDEEIDLEGIQLYVETELLGDIISCLLIKDHTLRKKYRNRFLRVHMKRVVQITKRKSKQLINIWILCGL